MSTLGSLELALVLGFRHALDADHVAAVGTLIEPDLKVRSITGTALRWALGHAVTLLAIGAVLIALGMRLPARFESLAELSVASLLIGLGVWRLWRSGSHRYPPRGAFLVGVLHGMAGSGPLVLVAVSTLQQKSHALVYLALVAFGTLLGMVTMAGAFALPLAKAAAYRSSVQRAFGVSAALASIAAGIRLGAALL